MSDIVLKRCGIRFDPPSIIIFYSIKGGTKLYRRTMPLRNFTKLSGVSRVAEELRTSSRHNKYIELMSTAQLERLITMIRDKLNGISKADIIQKASMDVLHFYLEALLFFISVYLRLQLN